MIQQLLLLVASVLVSGDPSKCVVEAPAESGAERTAWEALIWPVGSDVFFKDHYERAPLHLRRASHPEYWEDRFKLTQQTLETLLEMQGAVREDPVLKNPHTGLSQANCDAVLDGMDAMQANFSDNLYHAYLNGATIVCNLVPAFWPAAAREMSSYRGVTGYGWMANLYLTPSAAQGFSMHTDNTDGLVAQLYGSKQWTMHNSTLPLPYREQRVGRREQPGHETVMESQPAFEATINQGDLLLVPRGYVHMARATDDAPSAHLTLSAVKVPSIAEFLQLMIRFFPVEKLGENGAQFMHHILYEALEYERQQPINHWLRRSVPPRFGEELGRSALESAIDSVVVRMKEMVGHQMARQMHQNKEMSDGFNECFEALARHSHTRDAAITTAIHHGNTTAEYVERLQQLGLAQQQRVQEYSTLDPDAWFTRTALSSIVSKCDPHLCIEPHEGTVVVLRDVEGLLPLLISLVAKPASERFQLMETVGVFPQDEFARICLLRLLIKHGLIERA